MLRFFFVLLGFVVFLVPASAQTVRVISGDTIEIDGQVHRLHGIDAPEFAQVCKDKNGKDWRCGEAVAEKLQRMAENGAVTCEPIGRDYYGRHISHCFYYGLDLNARLVREGDAWAFLRYAQDYAQEEELARREGLGIWQAHNQRAEVFRDFKWQIARDIAPDGCPIKGDINAQRERVYFMPWDQHYTQIRISSAHGERWFCDEAEARFNGWRAVRSW